MPFEIAGITWGIKNSSTSLMFSPNIYLTSFSQNTDRHQLVISSSKLAAFNNEHITGNLPQIYFEYEEVLKLEKLISDDNIENSIKKETDKKSKEDDLFQ